VKTDQTGTNNSQLIDEQFSLAQRISKLAIELDEMTGVPCHIRSMTVNVMHAMAIKLAGDREGEIYDLTEETA
jgi:hypothetical protein